MGEYQLKRAISALLTLALMISLAACGNGGSAGNASDSSGAQSVPASIDTLKLGTDYKDLKANLKFITNRTDVVDTTYKQYVLEFQKLYPNINITYQADTNYSDNMTTRLTTNNWGDICMIPTTLKKDQLSSHFISLGKKSALETTYQFLDNFSYQNETYGLPSTSSFSGVVYNKAVFKKAGITTLPKTPDEFLSDLQQIKAKTDAIPLYTNFAAGWTMGAWDAYIGGTATGDPDALNKLVHAKNPFSKPADGSLTGPYAVYYTLYGAVNKKLTEADPTTTDWEGSKNMINSGKVATMVLGSWAIPQMQQAGSHPDDIGYMPFPISVNGKQYVSIGAGYNYGINKFSSKDNQTAAMLYVKWLVENSNDDTLNGGLPTVKSHKLPTFLDAFQGVTQLTDKPAPAGEEDLFGNVSTSSELSLNSDNKHVQSIVEAAVKGSPAFDSLMDNWNQKWTTAQKKYNALK